MPSAPLRFIAHWLKNRNRIFDLTRQKDIKLDARLVHIWPRIYASGGWSRARALVLSRFSGLTASPAADVVLPLDRTSI